VLGIVNALTVSITDRRRELGVLQAVGGLRGQIRHTIWLEAIGVGLIGLALGMSLGAARLYYTVEIARRDLSGIEIAYVHPYRVALALVPGDSSGRVSRRDRSGRGGDACQAGGGA